MNAVIQTLISGTLLGGLYALVSLGMSMTWAVLRVINYALFAWLFLMAYVTYQLATFQGINPLLTVFVTVPLGVFLACALRFATAKANIDTFASLIITFGLFLIVQSVISLVWSNDLVRIPSESNPYFDKAWHIGELTIPLLPALTFVVAVLDCLGCHWFLVHSYVGKAMRAMVQDQEMATAFGVDTRRLGYVVAAVSGASIALGGSALGMMFVITPTDAQLWVPVVFGVVLLAGLGNAKGVLLAAILVALIESSLQRFYDPSMAKLAPLALLLVVILFRPSGLFRPLVERASR